MTRRYEMAKYRKLPVIIEAVQLKWENWNEVCELFAPGGLEDNKPEGCFIGENGKPLPKGHSSEIIGLLIPTLEGTMLAVENDWIIKGVAGEIYPCKPEIFSQTYEKV
jgi:hypothetical protein